MIPIVILASGRGSNFDAIWKQIQSGSLPAQIRAVVSDCADARVLGQARSVGIQAIFLPFPKAALGISLLQRRQLHERQLLKALDTINPKFLVMAGYMKIVTSYLIEAFRCDKGYSRMVNIHPSILPAFPGLNGYAQAYRYGAQLAGVTVHLVEADVDSGPICAQETFSITDCKSEGEVEERGLKVEHQIYPRTLKWVLAEEFTLERRSEGRLSVRPY